MPETWIDRKVDADTCWPDVEAIIRRLADRIVKIEPASVHDDRELARDYVVASGWIAARLRRPRRWNRRGEDITIRCSSNPSELQKFIRGDVDWMLTGWRQPTAPARVPFWIFSDVRRIIECRLYENRRLRFNPDGSNWISIPTEDLVKATAIVDSEPACVKEGFW